MSHGVTVSEDAEPGGPEDEPGGPPARRLRELLRRQFGTVPPESPSEGGSEPRSPPAAPAESEPDDDEEIDH
jgi:hypothetical protein